MLSTQKKDISNYNYNKTFLSIEIIIHDYCYTANTQLILIIVKLKFIGQKLNTTQTILKLFQMEPILHKPELE